MYNLQWDSALEINTLANDGTSPHEDRNILGKWLFPGFIIKFLCKTLVMYRSHETRSTQKGKRYKGRMTHQPPGVFYGVPWRLKSTG